MTIQFQAHYQNGVLVPDEKVELPEHRPLTITVSESSAERLPAATPGRVDDPADPRPEGGVDLIDWWARHRLQIDPAMLDRIVRSKAYTHYEEPDDEP